MIGVTGVLESTLRLVIGAIGAVIGVGWSFIAVTQIATVATWAWNGALGSGLKMFGKFIAGVASSTTTIWGYITSAGVATTVSGGLTTAVSGLTTAVWGLNAAILANPIGAILVALAGLATLTVVVAKKFDVLSEDVLNLNDALSDLDTQIGSIDVDTILALEKPTSRMARHFRAITQELEVWDEMIVRIEGVMNQISNLASDIENFINQYGIDILLGNEQAVLSDTASEAGTRVVNQAEFVFNVDGSGDPRRTAQMTREEFKKHQRRRGRFNGSDSDSFY